MNIVTYCSAVAISPVRKYAIGLYVGTLSWENFKRTGVGVLQLLNENHIGLVDLLGKQSGRDVDKLETLARKHDMRIEEWHDIPILSGCSGALLVRLAKEEDEIGKEKHLSLISCGDHEVAICDVVDSYCGDKATPLLTTGILRERGLL